MAVSATSVKRTAQDPMGAVNEEWLTKLVFKT